MTGRDKPLGAELAETLATLRAELGEMLHLRWRLARLEIEADIAQAKRLAIALLAAAVMALAVLPLWLTALAEWLDGLWGVGRAGWAAGFGGLLAVSAAAVAFLAWRRFRRRLVALSQTIEELHEDAVWLGEWLGRNGAFSPTDSPDADGISAD